MSSKKKAVAATPAAAAPAQYAELLGEIKQRIRHAQARAWMAVNADMIRLYWSIGQVIDRRQRLEGYGTAVIPRLSRDLHNELPEEKGFSERNIKRMLAFFRLYPSAALGAELVPQPVAQAELPPAGAADALVPLRSPRQQRPTRIFRLRSCLPSPGDTMQC